MSTDNRQSAPEEQTEIEKDAQPAPAAASESQPAGQDTHGSGVEQDALPDWAVRQMESPQAVEQGEDADEQTAHAASDAASDKLPDWATRKMEQFQASEGDGPSAQHAGQGAQTSPADDGFDAGAVALESPLGTQARQSAPNLEMMLDLPLDATVELGRAELPLAQVLALKSGSVIQLDRLPGEPVDLLVNGQLVARGEIVVLNDTFAFRITELVG